MRPTAPLTGQAIPSYGPPQAAQYFRKLECFCFSRQTLQPGERRQMPVVFVVDASLPADVGTITLSYTFFEVEGADKSMTRSGAHPAPGFAGQGVSAMGAVDTGAKPYYFVPQPSYWPLVGSVALLLLGMGAAFWMNAVAAGPWMVAAGFGVLLVMLFGWFGAVIGESEARLYNTKVDSSFRWSMSWFIFSEVMFFFAFFGTLFYIRSLSVPDLGSLMSKLVWPDYTADWPTNGPYIDEQFTPMGAIGIPLLNTIILLSSGFTLTVAHHALRAGHRGGAQALALRDHRAGLHVPGLPGVRIHPCLQRAQPQAVDGRLRLDVLHAHGVPRRARDDRRDHALGDARARDQGPLRQEPPLRLRGRRVVLALRRRGLAAAFVLVYWL